MRITREIQKALHEAREHFGDYAELSRRSGVAQSTLSRYVNGTTKSIDDHNWDKLRGFLSPFLENTQRVPPAMRDTVRNTPELRECIKDGMMREGIRNAEALNRLIGYDSAHTLERLLSGKINWFPDILSAVLAALHIDPDSAPISAAERMLLVSETMFDNGGAMLVRPVPVVDWANAADYVSSLVSGMGSVSFRWDPETTETVPAPMGMRRGTVALRVAGQSMEPRIQDGDKLFCEPVGTLEEIQNNRVVVVRFNETYEPCPGCIVCKRLKRFGKTVCLTSDNDGCRSFDDVKDADITWLGVVVGKYSEIF